MGLTESPRRLDVYTHVHVHVHVCTVVHVHANVYLILYALPLQLVSIRIISGQRLPKPEGGDKDGEVIDPYVVVSFTGVPADKYECKTKVINDNG